MNKKSKVLAIVLGVLIAIVSLLLCLTPFFKEKKDDIVDETTKIKETENDNNIEEDNGGAIADNKCSILLGVNSLIEGNGAILNGLDVIINSGGTYTISGNSVNGSVIVRSTEPVVLLLDNLKINTEKEGIVIENDVNVTLRLSGESSINDGINNLRSAAIFSVGDLRIEGDGVLHVTGNKKGIHAKDLSIHSGTVVSMGDESDVVPNDTSKQKVMMFSFKEMISGGLQLSLFDENSEILNFLTKKNNKCVMISSPRIIDGQYYLKNGEEKVSIDGVDTFKVNGIINMFGSL